VEEDFGFLLLFPKKKSLLFNEAQLLKGLTPKKVHADEIVDIFQEVFVTSQIIRNSDN
jgi:hypothetical protein